MQECWVREAAEKEGWNWLEHRQPTIPQVGVSEVSRGERRTDSRFQKRFQGDGGIKGPPLHSHGPTGAWVCPQAPNPPLELQRSSLPSLRVCLVG